MKINWLEITLEVQKQFEKALKRYPIPGHEYSFANFFTWKENKNYLYASYKDHIIIADTSVSKNWKLYEPIGPNPHKIIQEVLPISDAYSWVRVSSKTAHKLTVDAEVVLDRDNNDYLYSVEQLTSIEGKKYDAKRNYIRRFHEQYTATIRPIDQKNINDCYQLSIQWAKEKNLSNNGDLFPLQQLVHHFESFSFEGIGIYINNKMVGFALGEALSDDTFGERYEKGFTEYIGIYPVLLHELAKYLKARFTYINREQDLGIPGLRKSKRSWNPCGFVGKYMLPGRRGENQIKTIDGITIYASKVLNTKMIEALYTACEWSVIDREPEQLAYALEHSSTVLTAWQNETLVGLATAISDGALTVYFPHLLVHPEHQKQGIGTILMQAMLEQYKSFDQKILISHKEAIGFYQTLGFQATSPHTGMWIHNSTDL